ncbi:MAG: hypothetical protein KAQ79_08565 [Cyclobacteriaceae bacterium]|nr:hypothetical protein [Cyclobacteriaceae bacterium]
MSLTKKVSRKNFYAFLWHAGISAIALSFVDVDTVIPAMLINAGGTSVHVGILTAILIGGTRLSQLFFAPYINSKSNKKGLLITGIYLRMIALAGMAVIFFSYDNFSNAVIISLVFILMTGFSLGGAFATISYTDILGKSILENLRKSFFSMRQIIASSITLISAWFAGYLLKQYDYPVNYIYVFAIAALALLIASFGFWKIKEVRVTPPKLKKGILVSIIDELKSNQQLSYYLLLTNTLGLGYAILPFILLMGKEQGDMSDAFVSNLLLTKMSGLILASVFIFFFSKKIKYALMLKGTFVLGIIFPLFAWFFTAHAEAYYLTFFLGGMYGSLFLVSSGGILLEISNLSNRAIYAGISGAGNILPTLIPLAAGVIISQLGFQAFFITNLIITLSSLYFIYKLDCLK